MEHMEELEIWIFISESVAADSFESWGGTGLSATGAVPQLH